VLTLMGLPDKECKLFVGQTIEEKIGKEVIYKNLVLVNLIENL
jgi:hypothetical protein